MLCLPMGPLVLSLRCMYLIGEIASVKSETAFRREYFHSAQVPPKACLTQRPWGARWSFDSIEN